MMLSLLAARAVAHRSFLGCYASFQVGRHIGWRRLSTKHPSRCISHSLHHATASSTTSCNDSETNNLENILKEAYNERDTDGVVDVIRANNIVEQLSSNNNGNAYAVADKLVSAAINAATSNKSLAAILNAQIASCCGDSSGSINNYPQIALAMLDLIDEMHDEDESTMIKPDLVTLSLVYYSLTQQKPHQQEENPSTHLILERAQQMSTKAAGSSRRRALAAERRKGSNNNNAIDTKEAEKQLQSIYGPDIHILQETDDLIVFSKPAGQVCYHNRKTSAGKVSASRKKKKSRGTSEDDNDDGSKIDISLEDAVLDLNFALSTLNPVARAAAAAAASPLDKDKEGVIDEFVDGKPALSKYRVVSVIRGDDDNQGEGGVALLEVETLTGRKHQVRVHCSTIGHPIFLDPVYSSYQPPIPTSRRKTRKDTERKKRQKAENNNSGLEVSTQNDLPKAISDLAMTMIPGQEKFFLHAKSLCIPEFDVDVEAPLPKFWTETLDQL
ncbi:hypothetical protein ACHAWC_009504 [Mediolabrus comicus]